MNLKKFGTGSVNKLDREQRDYIHDRMREIKQFPQFKTREWRNRHRKRPENVRDAYKIIARWELGERRSDQKRERAFENLSTRVEREILFGDIKKALKMIEGVKRG